MKRVDSENFRRQSDQAAYENYKTSLKMNRYKDSFPDKITVVHDEVILKDPKHFNEWWVNN